MTAIDEAREIVCSPELHDQLVSHCLRKLCEQYLDSETEERKAYGVIGGRVEGARIRVTHVIPLRRNARWDEQHRAHMDQVMETTAIRSETPLDRRGWVADPKELFEAHQLCDRDGSMLLGSYHMHRVAWAHDPLRDTCTSIDTQLAAGSGMWVFIISTVDPARPTVRAFFEARNEEEAQIRVTSTPGTKSASEHGA